MFNLSGMEVLVILVLALVVLGPDKLPEAARKVGRAMHEVRRMTSGFQAELRDAMHEPLHGFDDDTVPMTTPTGLDSATAAETAEGAEAGGGDVTVDPPG